MNTHLNLTARTALALACLVSAIAGCGAKTGLRVPDGAAPMDAMDVTDAADVVELPDVPTRTYLGTDFWPVSTANGYLQAGNWFHFAVAIGNPSDVTVTATITGGALMAPQHVTIAPNATVTTTLPWVRDLVQNSGQYVACNDRPNFGEPADSALVQHGAYHVVTSAPVSVYQFNPLEFAIGNQQCSPRSYTNDASLLLPTPALTGNYLVLAHNSFGAAGSYVAIAAAGTERTEVDITLSADIRPGMGVVAAHRGDTVHYALEPGDVVQLISAGFGETALHGDDMTGTVVRASGPVAVFAGVDCTNISWPNDFEPACDHLEQQLFPEETWGRSVVVSQLRDRGVDEAYIVRILSREDGNTLSFTPAGVHPPVRLARGEYLDFESTADFVVDASAPILVAQFMEGQNAGPPASMGDPAMVLEVPTQQYRTSYAFVVPASYTASFLNVVSARDAVVVLDGVSMVATADPIAGTGWVVRRVPVRPGSHVLNTTDPAGAGLKVIGVAEYTSYMYPGGLDLTRLR